MNEPNFPQREFTQMETDDEIRKALDVRARPAEPAPKPAPSKPEAAPKPAPPPARSSNQPPSSVKVTPGETLMYRPTIRPPLAVLTIMDDGKAEGEMIRLRGTSCVIGRTEGDVRIPFDELVSTRHVEIAPRFTEEGSQYVITDLQSTNGMFVRVSRAILAHGTEFLVGNGRYRIEIPTNDAGGPPGALGATTRAWDSEPVLAALPLLVEVIKSGMGVRLPLSKPEYWIGSDSSCEVHRSNDPFTEGRHLRLFRDEKGWQAQNNKTLNGLWVRMNQVIVEDGCLFQIGEQRCRLQVGA
jgi:pSer/pThr/pTyr-binding forkhead associated (FHA) protein